VTFDVFRKKEKKERELLGGRWNEAAFLSPCGQDKQKPYQPERTRAEKGERRNSERRKRFARSFIAEGKKKLELLRTSRRKTLREWGKGGKPDPRVKTPESRITWRKEG